MTHWSGVAPIARSSTFTARAMPRSRSASRSLVFSTANGSSSERA